MPFCYKFIYDKDGRLIQRQVNGLFIKCAGKLIISLGKKSENSLYYLSYPNKNKWELKAPRKGCRPRYGHRDVSSEETVSHPRKVLYRCWLKDKSLPYTRLSVVNKNHPPLKLESTTASQIIHMRANPQGWKTREKMCTSSASRRDANSSRHEASFYTHQRENARKSESIHR